VKSYIDGGQMSIKILVTDGPNKSSLAVIRALKKENYYIGVASQYSKIFTLAAYSKYCNKTHFIETDLDDTDSYAANLLEILKSNNYDVLLPVGLKTYLTVSKYKTQFESVTKVVVPDWDSMEVAFNKDKTMDFAFKLNVPIPKTMVLGSEDDLKRIKNYPVVIKSSDNSGNFVKYCNDEVELAQKFTSLKLSSKTNIIAQEYISGFGCGFYGVYDKGKLIAHFLHKRIKEFPVTGGASAVAESYFDERLYRYGKCICDKLRWHGPIMVEFKYDINEDDYKLIEVNPKLWGSLDLTIEAGVNVPKILIDIAFNRNFNESNGYKYLKYKWIFPDECNVLASQFSSKNILELFMIDKNTKTNIYWDDPFPLLIQIPQTFINFLKIIFSHNKKYPHGKISSKYL
jgi:predicted ATP-grasp superfamily ATP-dependent carboligase